MRRIAVMVFLSVCAVIGSRVLAAPPAVNNGVQSMLDQGQSISRERRSLEAQQVALLKQKAELDAAGASLDQQQAALNQDIEASNQAIAQHNGKLDQNKSGCQQDNGSAGQTNDCNKDIKTLNTSTADLKAQQEALKQRQADLDAARQRHEQDAGAWNGKEQKTVGRLNAIYQGQNNWMDAANSLITGESFQALAAQTAAGTRCSNTVPRGDRITPVLLQKYADTIVGCLAYVAKHANDAPPAG